MRILIAPNSFRGSLDAFQIADAIAEGLKKSKLRIDECFIKPIADGGEMTADILVTGMGAEWIEMTVQDAYGENIQSRWGYHAATQTGIVELAKASGYNLVKHKQLKPLMATTYGTGQLIKAAIEKGCKKVIIGLGGSATVDGGMGIFQALGFRFNDKNGLTIGSGGGALGKAETLDTSYLSEKVLQTEFKIACDVENTLLGENGAARRFGPQKGCTLEDVELLEKNMEHWSKFTFAQLQKDMSSVKYGGAAGGVAAGLWAYLNAELISGAQLVFEKLDLESIIPTVDLVITAEGKLDEQSLKGKAPCALAELAKQYQKPVLFLGGAVPPLEELHNYPMFDAVFSITREAASLEKCVEETRSLVVSTAMNCVNLMAIKFQGN